MVGVFTEYRGQKGATLSCCRLSQSQLNVVISVLEPGGKPAEVPDKLTQSKHLC